VEVVKVGTILRCVMKLVKPSHMIVYAANFLIFSSSTFSHYFINFFGNMASFPVDKTLSVESARSDTAKPIKIWLDGAFDMMHYGRFTSLLISRKIHISSPFSTSSGIISSVSVIFRLIAMFNFYLCVFCCIIRPYERLSSRSRVGYLFDRWCQ